MEYDPNKFVPPIPGGRTYHEGQWVDAYGNPLDVEVTRSRYDEEIARLIAQKEAVITAQEAMWGQTLKDVKAEVVVDPISGDAPVPEGRNDKIAWLRARGKGVKGNVSNEVLETMIAEALAEGNE